MFRRRILWMIAVSAAAAACQAFAADGGAAQPARKKIVFISGPCPHSPGSHEAEAGARVMKYCLEHAPGLPRIETAAFSAWPADDHVLRGAAAVVFTGDLFPPERFPERDRAMAALRELMAEGCGIVCLHYALGLDAKTVADDGTHPLLDWLGGYYAANCKHHKSSGGFCEKIEYRPAAGNHPMLRGWRAFSFQGESYWDMYFGKQGPLPAVVPIATSMLPPEEPKPQITAWAFERKDGGRGVGLSPPHYFREWRSDDLRTLVLNGIVWAAKIEVPAAGVQCKLPDLSTFEPKSVEPTWLPPKWRKAAEAKPRYNTRFLPCDDLNPCLGLLLGAVAAEAKEPVAIFHVGNSLTDQAYGMHDIAKARGHETKFGRHMIPGAPLEWLWNHRAEGFREPDRDKPADEILRGSKWDVLILQPFGRPADNAIQYGANYAAAAYEGNPACQVYVFANYPEIGKDREKADQWEQRWLSETDTRGRAHFENVAAGIAAKFPDKKPVRIIPVGEAMYRLHLRMKDGKVPGFQHIADLYADGVHLNSEGKYLEAVTHYAAVFQEDPHDCIISGLRFWKAPYSVDKAFAQVVWDVVAQVTKPNPATDR